MLIAIRSRLENSRGPNKCSKNRYAGIHFIQLHIYRPMLEITEVRYTDAVYGIYKKVENFTLRLICELRHQWAQRRCLHDATSFFPISTYLYLRTCKRYGFKKFNIAKIHSLCKRLSLEFQGNLYSTSWDWGLLLRSGTTMWSSLSDNVDANPISKLS